MAPGFPRACAAFNAGAHGGASNDADRDADAHTRASDPDRHPYQGCDRHAAAFRHAQCGAADAFPICDSRRVWGDDALSFLRGDVDAQCCRGRSRGSDVYGYDGPANVSDAFPNVVADRLAYPRAHDID